MRHYLTDQIARSFVAIGEVTAGIDSMDGSPFPAHPAGEGGLSQSSCSKYRAAGGRCGRGSNATRPGGGLRRGAARIEHLERPRARGGLATPRPATSSPPATPSARLRSSSEAIVRSRTGGRRSSPKEG